MMEELKIPLFEPLHIHGKNVLDLLCEEKEKFIFIKNINSAYEYANSQFIDLMGVTAAKNIINCMDNDLYDDRTKVKIYKQYDEQVFDTEKSIEVSEEVAPKFNKLISRCMVGKLYPLYSGKSTPVGVMGIVIPRDLPFRLTLESAVNLSCADYDHNFVRRSYSVKINHQVITISRRELQCIIELIKGNHAGKIAENLKLKQKTIEYYLENLKNKLGATSKASLIQTVFQQKIIQQVRL